MEAKNQYRGGSILISNTETRAFSPNLTLREVLKDEEVSQQFLLYLQGGRSVENFYFWWEIENFQLNKTNGKSVREMVI